MKLKSMKVIMILLLASIIALSPTSFAAAKVFNFSNLEENAGIKASLTFSSHLSTQDEFTGKNIPVSSAVASGGLSDSYDYFVNSAFTVAKDTKVTLNLSSKGYGRLTATELLYQKEEKVYQSMTVHEPTEGKIEKNEDFFDTYYDGVSLTLSKPGVYLIQLSIGSQFYVDSSTYLVTVTDSDVTTTEKPKTDEPSSWAVDYVEQAKAYENLGSRLFSNYQTNISRADFAFMAVKIYEELTGKTAEIGNASFPDSTDEWVLKAKNLQIINGYPDGTFKPSNTIKRADLSIMFVNIFKAAGLNYGEANGPEFSDVASTHYAKDAIMIARNNGIVSGTGNNNFNPNGTASIQQALIMFVNTMNTFK